MRRNLFVVLSVIACLFAGCGSRSQLSLNPLGQGGAGGGGLCGDGENVVGCARPWMRRSRSPGNGCARIRGALRANDRTEGVWRRSR